MMRFTVTGRDTQQQTFAWETHEKASGFAWQPQHYGTRRETPGLLHRSPLLGGCGLHMKMRYHTTIHIRSSSFGSVRFGSFFRSVSCCVSLHHSVRRFAVSLMIDRSIAVVCSLGFQGNSPGVRRVPRAQRPRAAGGKAHPERPQQAGSIPAPQEGDRQDSGGQGTHERASIRS